MNRVAELADRTEAEAKQLKRIPFKSLVPLPEIIADAFDCGVNTKAVKAEYDKLIKKFNSEFNILLNDKFNILKIKWNRITIDEVPEKLQPPIKLIHSARHNRKWLLRWGGKQHSGSNKCWYNPNCFL